MYPYDPRSPSASPLEHMMALDTYAVALATLGPEEQQIVALYFHEEDLTLEEVAACCDVSKSTVQRYVAALREQIIRILQESDELYLLKNTEARLATVKARTACRSSQSGDKPGRAKHSKRT